jgi:hypothetical protein
MLPTYSNLGTNKMRSKKANFTEFKIQTKNIREKLFIVPQLLICRMNYFNFKNVHMAKSTGE